MDAFLVFVTSDTMIFGLNVVIFCKRSQQQTRLDEAMLLIPPRTELWERLQTTSCNIVDCSFKKKKDERKINEILFNIAGYFCSESEGPVHFKNTTMVSKVVGTETYAFSVFEISIGGFVIMDENSTIRCNRGFYLELENNTHFIYTEKNKSHCRKNITYWLIKRMLKREGESSESGQNNKDVLEVLHGPFRQPNEHDKGTLYWESVLIGRRFILLSCHAFIATPMFRMVCMAGACVIMLLHHVLKNPYRDPVANNAETLSLLSLVMMAVINLTKATLISFRTNTDGPAKSYVETLEWAEVGALAFVPTLLSIFVTFDIVSQFVRLMVTLAKIISRCVRWPRISLLLTRELERPLLEISEEE